MFKVVSELSLSKVAQTSAIIGRIDTTTLYHVTAMLWYHVKLSQTNNVTKVFILMGMTYANDVT